ncbi:MAG TPA: hypothetical protein VMV17_01670 [Streptosporangiaceae bacterium]|nr:hypothetical protein [Streptosporangiaceae bacterium]
MDTAAAPAGERPPLAGYDKILHALRAAHPHWWIWYVPCSGGEIRWCARPNPGLSCGSPEDLEDEIAEAEKEWAAEG